MMTKHLESSQYFKLVTVHVHHNKRNAHSINCSAKSNKAGTLSTSGSVHPVLIAFCRGTDYSAHTNSFLSSCPLRITTQVQGSRFLQLLPGLVCHGAGLTDNQQQGVGAPHGFDSETPPFINCRLVPRAPAKSDSK